MRHYLDTTEGSTHAMSQYPDHTIKVPHELYARIRKAAYHREPPVSTTHKVLEHLYTLYPAEDETRSSGENAVLCEVEQKQPHTTFDPVTGLPPNLMAFAKKGG